MGSINPSLSNAESLMGKSLLNMDFSIHKIQIRNLTWGENVLYHLDQSLT